LEEVRKDEEMNISSLACHALSEINLHWAVAWYFSFYISFSHPFFKIGMDHIQNPKRSDGL